LVEAAAMKRSGWGYAIDYDKAIAHDLAELAAVERYLAMGVFADPALAAEGIYDTLAHRVIRDASVAASLGVTADDRTALAMLLDAPLPDPLPADWYSRAMAVSATLDALWSDALLTLDHAKRLRSKVKTSLARHRRNADG
jgi:hypothetical protein